jgi:hypothetical protein
MPWLARDVQFQKTLEQNYDLEGLRGYAWMEPYFEVPNVLSYGHVTNIIKPFFLEGFHKASP